jgi:hypothetical protein
MAPAQPWKPPEPLVRRDELAAVLDRHGSLIIYVGGCTEYWTIATRALSERTADRMRERRAWA